MYLTYINNIAYNRTTSFRRGSIIKKIILFNVITFYLFKTNFYKNMTIFVN